MQRLGSLIPIVVITMALLFGLILGRLTAPSQTVIVRHVPLAPGSTRVESGVPIGYQHSQQGAIDAATNYLIAFNGPMVLRPDDMRAAVDTVTTPEYRAELETQTGKALQALESYYGISAKAQAGVTPVVKLIPIAFHADSYSGDEAGVSIWAVWLIAQKGILVPQQNWTTSHFALKWQGDWKVSASGTHPGPIPQPPQGAVPESSNPLPAAVSDFQEYTHVAS
jgi:hypothetical protein